MAKKLKLLNMRDDVAVEEVQWLWYPYIPFGKITIIQGDPGEGKTTKVLVIDKSENELSLCDERLELAIKKTGAKCVIGR